MLILFNCMNNARFTPTDAPYREVSGIQFSIMSSDEILRHSVVEITTTDMFDKGVPKSNGLYDLRMGSIDKRYKCQTCNQDLINCQGHFGHIVLAVPMYNISYFKQVYKILQCVCVRCSSLLIPADEIKRSNVTKARAMIRFKRVFDSVKKQSQCPACEFQQPKWTTDNSMNINCVFEDQTISLTSNHVLNVLRKINDDACNVLGNDPKYAHPCNMMFETLPVPPPVMRPSIVMDPMARTQDDLTHKLIEILKTNQQIVKAMKTKGNSNNNNNPNTPTMQEHITNLQYHINTYIDNEIPGVPQATQRTGRPIKSISQRIKTKEGRVRGNLMGKRVDFSARTVITAEPNIMLDELGVPETIARNLTISETVTELNKPFLQKCVDFGQDPKQIHEVGAKYVMRANNHKQKDLRFAKNVRLECGDMVERHLMDGDYVVFNRQPTLHRMSMMGHRVRVMTGNTFRLNLSATGPYNADALRMTCFIRT
jgi:DNA-directed RNA polymerase II subunit RPB1